MHVRVEGNDGGEDRQLAVEPEARVGDLLVALGWSQPHVTIDGVTHNDRVPLGETSLADGSVVTRRADDAEAVGARFRLVGGPDAGRYANLPPGLSILGREGAVAVADPSMSRAHLRVQVEQPAALTIADVGSTNGTTVDGAPLQAPRRVCADQRVRAGATVMALELGPVHNQPPGPARAHHRPPRAPLAAGAIPLDPPVTPRDVDRPRLAMATLAVPLATGIVLAGLYGPQMAVIAVIGPVVALGGWLAARTAADRAARRAAHAHRAALARFRDHAATAFAREADRRRTATPDLWTLLERVRRDAPTLWERRAEHDDFLHLGVGPGDQPWRVPTSTSADDEANAALTGLDVLSAVPVVLDAGTLVGIVGTRENAVCLARALVLQAMVMHGPADLHLAVLTSPRHADDWLWTRWLPHGVDPANSTRRTIATDAASAVDLAGQALDRRGTGDGPTTWWVVDGDDVDLARIGGVRALLCARSSPPRGIVIAPDTERLPSTCRAILDARRDGTVEVRVLDRAEPSLVAELVGVAVPTAETAARRLARLADPEAAGGAASLPDRCSLLPLLDVDLSDHDGLARRWRATAGTDELCVPIGVDAHGVVEIDLVRDGPHALVAGTTGSGKSELLRSFVAALAASADTDHCVLVLVDFKGGAAFDGLTDLPHVVGSVTDLDDRLAARALRCLEAELKRRERVLRASGVSDITAYVRVRRDDPQREPLPRLVVVIDEFATLVAELPEFVDGLVDVAQRGRSLGVHLVLATQRPAGAVKDSIRTNTNLRIALRVVEDADSRDVIGVSDAAHLPRSRPGRALVRSGSSAPQQLQTAHVGGTTPIDRPPAVVATPWSLTDLGSPTPTSTGPTDLERLVSMIAVAHEARDAKAPRRPWPEPLPVTLCLDDLRTADAAPGAFALADQPEQQRMSPVHWEPADGNLVIAGLAGSGVSTGLASVIHALVDRRWPVGLHVYALGTDTQVLDGLRSLPQCGVVAPVHDVERVVHLLRRLDAELRLRRTRAERGPSIVTVVDGINALRASLDDAGLVDEIERIERLAADGPAAGIAFAFGAEHPSAVGHRLDRTITTRVLLRLSDRADYVQAGLHGADPAALGPGRGFLGTGEEVQIAKWGLRRRPATIASAPWAIEALPCDVAVDQLGAAVALDAHTVTVPFALGDRLRQPVGLSLRPGDHVLVAGPARSGKSSTLDTIRAVLDADGRVRTVRVGAGDRFAAPPSTGELQLLVDELLADDHPTVVCVDDADVLDDGGMLQRLVLPGRAGLHVVASGRPDRLRGLFRHWTADVRRARLGLLLRGDDVDGELLGARVPRRHAAPWHPGRGWLVTDDGAELCQVARPSAIAAAPMTNQSEETNRCA